MERLRRRAGGTYDLTAIALDVDDEPVAISGPATATITDDSGSEVWTGIPDIDDAGALVAHVPAEDLQKLDVYHIDWTGKVGDESQAWKTDHELVGDFIIELAAVRGFDRAFSDTDKYPDAVLAAARDAVEDVYEENGMCAFRPRGTRVTVHGSGLKKLVMPDTDLIEVYSVAVAGTPLTDAELADVRLAGNVLYREAGWPIGFANIAVHYAYGYRNVPARIRQTALQLAKEAIVPSQFPARATATSVNDMAYRITIAGRDGFTGIPDVDASIQQFGRVRPVVG